MDPTETTRAPRFALMFRWRVGSWRLGVERAQFSHDQLVARYDRAAPRWPQLVRWLGLDAMYARLCLRLLEHHGRLAEGARVLDCGAGSAAMSLALARASRARLVHHLLDASPRMLQAASAGWARRVSMPR